MKYTSWMLVVSICCSLLMLNGCATNPNNHGQTPTLQDFQTRTLPTGGSDAAQAANSL
ncbi:MAG TPA: hypothetical protein VHZ76_06870 [Gammaproteobacteria bacterium]|jgi:hypothetical protein|nr:hypothetical protein [Gammaproteobacteria bacterium]